ncbi:MAG TPA: adenosylcobinamide-GDP ribazoletransferase [Acidimicrobiales bacterium]|nr:adenosylcobinamide-GDP ribazoletransferase [Acidimicrobiales bacterium]
MRAALGFLTVVGGAAAPNGRAPAWFGVVGAGVGLVVGGAWWIAGELWPPLLAAVLAVAADAALTGMLHLDGLADAADGLLPPVDRERRLAIMAAPDVGAFGVATLVIVLVARVGALAVLAPDPLLVVGLWCAARASMALALATVPYARSGGGSASGFAGPVSTAATLTLVGAVGAVVAAAGAGPGSASVAAALAAFAAVIALAVRRLGGYTGDVLGAAGVVAETVGLLVAAARW